MDRLLKLTELEMDALREVGNIGVGNATTALSKMIDKKIKIIIPNTKFVPIEHFANELGGPEKVVAAFYVQLLGDIGGQALFMIPDIDALKLTDLINGKPTGTTKLLTEVEISVLKEMMNIFCGSYLNALSDLTGLRMLPSIPGDTVDMVQSILDFMLAKISIYAKNVLSVKATINVETDNVNADFILFFDIESYKKILTEIRKKYELDK